MFNALQSTNGLFLTTLFSFFILFTIRQLFIKRNIWIFLYHLSLFSALFIMALGGGGVQNDGYDRLEKFILLEKNGNLLSAKKSPQDYDPALRLDLQEFNDSQEFRDYLKKYDATVDQAEALFIGWVFAFLAEIALFGTKLLKYAFTVLKKRRGNSKSL